jgi:hypothetical protein
MQGVPSGVTNSELRVRVQSEGALRVLTFPSTQTVWFGRDGACDVVLPSPQVSRRHLSLFVNGEGELVLRDHSTYGSRVNGRPVQRALRPLAPPASIEVGPYRLEVTMEGGQLGVRLLTGSFFSRSLSRLFGSRAHPPARTVGRFLAAAGLGGVALAVGLCAGRDAAHTLPARSSLRDRPCPSAPAGASEPSVLSAARLLHAGERLAAFHVYRALAERADSRAELSIVSELLARELSCQP